MTKKRSAIIISEDGINHTLHYYVRQADCDNFFGCEMYNVGIKLDDAVMEIENFSPSLNEAETLLEELYENYITPNYLFSVAEEFIVSR